jgi:hypothetical protein
MNKFGFASEEDFQTVAEVVQEMVDDAMNRGRTELLC